MCVGEQWVSGLTVHLRERLEHALGPLEQDRIILEVLFGDLVADGCGHLEHVFFAAGRHVC
jgi:hypothetical protein